MPKTEPMTTLKQGWDMFEETFLKLHFPDIPPMLRDIIRASFYCGAQCSSSIIAVARDGQADKVKPEVRVALALATVDKLIAEADKTVDEATLETMARRRYPAPPHFPTPPPGYTVVEGPAAMDLLKALVAGATGEKPEPPEGE